MKRQNSRNKESSDNPAYHFNLTAGNKSSHQDVQPMSRQQPISDLNKASSLMKNEIHQLIDGLHRPDESMTLSSFSQSPNIGRFRAVNTNEDSSSHHNYTGGMGNMGMADILGRSEIDQTSELIDKSSHIKSLSITGGTNRRPQTNYSLSYQDDNDNEDRSLDGEPQNDYDGGNPDEDNGEDTVDRSISINNKYGYRSTNHIDQSDDEEELDEDNDNVRDLNYEEHEDYDQSRDETMNKSNSVYGGGRDSPDFNRHNAEHDDLTISNNTAISNINTTYRDVVKNDNMSTKRDKQSRTFADSVVHSQNKQESLVKAQNQPIHNNSHRTTSDIRGFQNQKRRNNVMHDHDQLVTTDENVEDPQDEDHSGEEEKADTSNLDTSDMDSFTHTQRSYLQKSKFIYQKNLYNSKHGQSQMEDLSNDQILSQRSPISYLTANDRKAYDNDQDQSLDLTAMSQGITQRSMMTNKPTANNRTSNSDQSTNIVANPLSNTNNANGNTQFERRMTNNLHNVLQTHNYNATTVMNKGLNAGNRHNRSLQRDSELEQALEENSIQQINNLNSIESNGGKNKNTLNSYKANGGAGDSSEFKKLRLEISKLQREKEQFRMANEHNENQCQNMHSQQNSFLQRIDDLELELINKSEHILLLKGKQNAKGQNSLEDLRGRVLNNLRQEMNKLSKDLKKKEQIINELETKLQKIAMEDKQLIQVFEQQIQTQITEIDTQNIKINALKKQIQMFPNEKQKIVQDLENEFEMQKKNFENDINLLVQQLNEMNRHKESVDQVSRDFNFQIKNKDKEITSMQKELKKYAQSLETQGAQMSKYQEELNNYKGRCKDLEQEIEQTRCIENNSMFSNQLLNKSQLNNMNKSGINSNQGGNDYEIAKIKALFNQQLSKEKENSAKWKRNFEEADIKFSKLKEEMVVKQQEYQEKCQNDAEFLKEIDRTKHELATIHNLEQKIRECFNMHSRESIDSKLLQINEQLEQGKNYQQEYQKCYQQLLEVQASQKQLHLQQYKENNDQNTNPNSNNSSVVQGKEMSDFRQNLLLQKTALAEQLDKKLKNEQTEREKTENLLFASNQTVNLMKNEIENYQSQFSLLNKEIEKISEGKAKAEQNVEKLKENLREKLREIEILQQNQLEMSNQSKRQNLSMLEQAEKKRQAELIQLILDLNLATDPLQSVNMSLQQSFIDEYEQAIKHLEEQKKLVRELISTLSKENQKNIQKIQQKEEEIQNIMESNDQLNRENLIVMDQVKEKDKQIGDLREEAEAQRNYNEKLTKQLKENEQICQRLRSENEEQKNDLRKLMRTQEHLFKDNSTNKRNTPSGAAASNSSIRNTQEYERIVMVYEDQLSKYLQQISKLQAMEEEKESFDDEGTLRNKCRDEVIEMLDKLIDNRTNMPTFNDLAVQLVQRIDKIRSQEQMVMSLQSQLKRSNGGAERSKSSDNRKIYNIHNMNEAQIILKSSHGSGEEQDNQLVETSRFEGESNNNNNNGQELVWSIANYFKQSATSNNVKNPNQANNGINFKNFFQNDDNTLLLSELFTQQQNNNNIKNPNQELTAENEGLKKDIATKIQLFEEQLNSTKKQNEISLQELKTRQELEVNELQERLVKYEKQLQEFQDQKVELKKQLQIIQNELALKDQQLKQSNEEIEVIMSDKKNDQNTYESVYIEKQKQVRNELDTLKEQMRKELMDKAELIEQEYIKMDDLKVSMRDDYEKKARVLEDRYTVKLETQDKEYRQKLQAMEKDIRNGCEKNQDELVTKIQRELEEQWEKKVKNLKDESNLTLKQMKEDWQKDKDENRRSKDKESKRFKEEIDKIKKSWEEKVKKIVAEKDQEKENIEAEHKIKLENQSQKSKKEIKAQCDKVRAEMRNLIDNAKNDNVKAKAEWEREKKKIQQDYQSELDKLRQDHEDSLNQALKQERDKLIAQQKKKVDEKEKENARKIESLEEDIIQLKESQYREMDKIKQIQKEDLERQKHQYEKIIREEKAAYLPTLNGSYESEYAKNIPLSKVNVETQCNILINDYKGDAQNEVLDQQSYIVMGGTQTKNCGADNQSLEQSIYTQVTNSQVYIEQLKYNFEEELERQQLLFEMQLQTKQNLTVRTFEEILTLELDKMLQSIYHKTQTAGMSNVQQKNRSQQDIDMRRRDINQVIADILSRNDDRKERQMKASLDNIKKKITEVLKQFKTELENKNTRKQSEMVQVTNKTDQQMRKGIEQCAQSNNNMSDLVYTNENVLGGDFSECSSDVQSERQYSQQNSLPPTPRSNSFVINKPKLAMVGQIKNNKQQRSDIKQYTEFINEDESSLDEGNKNGVNDNCFNNNILKKIAPVPNQRGVMVVEVSKIVRDLKMLQQTVKQAKFYRMLVNVSEWGQAADSSKDSGELEEERDTNVGECAVQVYRQLLNDFFRLIVKLNSGVDSVGKAEEVYKLKLTNSELRAKLNNLEKEREKTKQSIQVEEILNHYGSTESKLSSEGMKVISKLEQTQFQVNKLQFTLYQLVDNFTNQSTEGGYILDKNTLSVNQKCKDYVIQNPNQFTNIDDQNMLLQSEYSPDGLQQYQSKICPEMLSPEETAQLIAQVFQKLDQPQTNAFTLTSGGNGLSQTNNNQFETYQSFFQTFMSNEDYMKSAENFIKKYREHQQFGNTLRNPNKSNLPLQMGNDHYNTQHMVFNNNFSSRPQINSGQFSSINSCPPFQGKSKRSMSSNSAQNQMNQNPSGHNSCYLVLPSNDYKKVTNVFQQNHLQIAPKDQRSSINTKSVDQQQRFR